jgi:hypothetical protein
VTCHDQNVVAEITPFSSFQEYPPSVVTPTPFSCANCHWQQAVVPSAPGFNPDTSPQEDAGHPSTYDHAAWWGDFMGYFEYGRPVLPNVKTHHMGPQSGINSQCFRCHGSNPNDPSWNPDDPELIRFCETCHDVSSLHTILPHVSLNFCSQTGRQ